MEPDFFSGSSEKLSGSENDEGKRTKRGLKWLRDLQNWFSIDPYYYFVILLDSLLFMLIHVGKPLSEVLTAFPGGVFLALLAFKFKSFLPCYLIHTMTAGTIIFLIIIINWNTAFICQIRGYCWLNSGKNSFFSSTGFRIIFASSRYNRNKAGIIKFVL